MQNESLMRDRLRLAVGLHYIAHRLGQAGRTERWLRGRIDWLVANAGFPSHLPSPKPNERVYNARAVDAWFDGQLGSADHARINAADRTVWQTVLDARAASIGAGQ
jgi:hypothetical protein